MHYSVPVLEVLVDILYLCGKNMWHSILYCGRDIDDGLIISLWLPYIKHSVAHINRIIHLSARKALR